MTVVPNVMRNLGHIHSYRIFVCYTILVVVRAEERVEDSAQRTTFQRPNQEPLDRHVTDEDIRPLRSAVSGTGADWEAVTVREGSDDNVSHQITQRSVELQLPAVITREWNYLTEVELFFVNCFLVVN
jgi:hypothetical protein